MLAMAHLLLRLAPPFPVLPPWLPAAHLLRRASPPAAVPYGHQLLLTTAETSPLQTELCPSSQAVQHMDRLGRVWQARSGQSLGARLYPMRELLGPWPVRIFRLGNRTCFKGGRLGVDLISITTRPAPAVSAASRTISITSTPLAGAELVLWVRPRGRGTPVGSKLLCSSRASRLRGGSSLLLQALSKTAYLFPGDDGACIHLYAQAVMLGHGNEGMDFREGRTCL